jgi:hypothetical protein
MISHDIDIESGELNEIHTTLVIKRCVIYDIAGFIYDFFIVEYFYILLSWLVFHRIYECAKSSEIISDIDVTQRGVVFQSIYYLCTLLELVYYICTRLIMASFVLVLLAQVCHNNLRT